MDATETVPQSIGSEREALRAGKTVVQLWLEKIAAAKLEEEKWRESAERAQAVYEAGADHKSHFNIYHANVEVLIPALYNSTPIPDVRARHERATLGAPFSLGAPAHDVSLSEITERALSTAIELFDFDDVIEDCVRDAAVTGRGVVRVRYAPVVTSDDQVTSRVTLENVPWNRFVRGPGVSWQSVPFVAFAHHLTKDQLLELTGDAQRVEKFGFQSSDETTAARRSDVGKPHAGVLKTVPVYEVWDRINRQVVFLTDRDTAAPLLIEDDPLQLPEFFPVVRPMQFVRRLDSLVPICPYDVYAPLIDEIDRVSRRIQTLIRQLVVKGGYDPKLAPDFAMLQDVEDGTYIPISASDEFLKGGGRGLADAVLHWPLEQLMAVISALYQEREQIKTTIYEVMGLADIMRGSVDPREKLGQSQLKAQTGSLRLRRSQSEVQRVTVAAFRMMAHLLHHRFEPETLAALTGSRITPETLAELRRAGASHRIDIETDSTVRADMTRFQDELNAFLGGTAMISQAAAGLAPVLPQAVPALFAVYGSFARKFNLGKAGEEALDRLADVANAPPAPQAEAATPPPDPAALAAQQAAEADARRRDEVHQADMQLKALDMQGRARELEHAAAIQALQRDLAALQRDLAATRVAAAQQKLASTAGGLVS